MTLLLCLMSHSQWYPVKLFKINILWDISMFRLKICYFKKWLFVKLTYRYMLQKEMRKWSALILFKLENDDIFLLIDQINVKSRILLWIGHVSLKINGYLKFNAYIRCLIKFNKNATLEIMSPFNYLNCVRFSPWKYRTPVRRRQLGFLKRKQKNHFLVLFNGK